MAATCLQIFLFACLSGILLTGIAADSDKYLEFGGVKVQVAGKSGKIKLWRDKGNEDGASHVMITMDELKEVDSSGDQVGNTGSVKHSFNSFASQDFAFSTPAAETVPGSNVTAEVLRFQGQLKDLPSTLQVTLFLAKEDGEIIINEESHSITAGQLMLTVELTDWAFCGCGGGASTASCDCSKGQTSQTGAFVDLAIEIKGHDKSTVAEAEEASEDTASSKFVSFDLGNNGEVSFSTQVEIDGTWQDMATNYPKSETQGNKLKTTLRYDRFNTRAYSYSTVEAGGASLTLVLSLWSLLAALLVTLRLL